MEAVPTTVRRRVSDVERDAVVELLGDALADGRISTNTFLTRVDRTFASRDEASLRSVLLDLVEVSVDAGRPHRPASPPTGALALLLPTSQQPLVDIGRRSTCDVCLGDPTVSARHATLVRLRDGWVVVDRASTNGTYVGDRRVEGSARIRPGDRLGVGATSLLLVDPSAPRPGVRERWTRRIRLT